MKTFMAKNVTVFSDGAYSTKQSLGGFGTAICRQEEDGIYIMQAFAGRTLCDTTVNQMELISAIKGIYNTQRYVSHNSIQLFSDSQYTIKAFTEWCKNWVRNGWKTSAGKPVLNKELIQFGLKLLKESKDDNVRTTLKHVNGHAGVEGNELCNSFAWMIYEKDIDVMNHIEHMKGIIDTNPMYKDFYYDDKTEFAYRTLGDLDYIASNEIEKLIMSIK